MALKKLFCRQRRVAALFLLEHCNSHLQATLAADPQHVDAKPSAAKVKIEPAHLPAAECK